MSTACPPPRQRRRAPYLAISQTLLAAWYGIPTQYDHNEGALMSWRVAAQIARELHAIEQKHQGTR